MSFYLRKAVKVGPFRFNISKSGVGVSAGVKGLRLGTGPRGNYVHMGRNGLYYRRSLNPAGSQDSVQDRLPQGSPVPSLDQTVGPMHEIESADVLEMVDVSAEELIIEIREKIQKRAMSPISLIASGIALVILLISNVPGWAYGVLVAVGLIAWLAARYTDQVTKSVVILYEFEPDSEGSYSRLHAAFSSLGNCQKVWHIPAEGDVLDKKYHAGASKIVTRSQISPKVGERWPIRSNVKIPRLGAGKQEILFMPERVLVFESNAVGAVPYGELHLQIGETNFVEDQGVPDDAEIVDYTWRYVNKKGGPDLRFKDNPRIPVARYQTLSLKSPSGLNERFQLSHIGVAEPFRIAVENHATQLSEVHKTHGE